MEIKTIFENEENQQPQQSQQQSAPQTSATPKKPEEILGGTFESSKQILESSRKIESEKTMEKIKTKDEQEIPKPKEKTETHGEKKSKTASKKESGKFFLAAIIAVAVLALVFALFKKQTIIQKPKTGTHKQNLANSKYKLDKIEDLFNFKKANSDELYVAKIHIDGVIQEANQTYNQKWLISTIEELKDDPQNLGILLVIDSPGGTVYEADETYLALCDYKTADKYVWAYFKSLAASGGYYISCAAETIHANRNALTGSIGVIAGTSIDATSLLEKAGIKSTTFTAGKNKNMLNYNSPLTEEQRQIMQSVADDAYDQFTKIVSNARQKSIEEVSAIADGRIYTAKQAKANGLIDSIETLESTQEQMRERISTAQNLSLSERESINFYNYIYEYKPPLFNRFLGMMAGENAPTSLFVDPITKAALEMLAPNIKYPAYLYKN